MTPEPDTAPPPRRARPAPGTLRPLGAYRTKRELVYGALRDAIHSGKPAVVDVIIDRGPTVDDLRAAARRPTET